MAGMEEIAPLFEGWEETMIWSCLQGHMGYALTDRKERPESAQIVVGDFCFFAGRPDRALAEKAAATLIAPQNERWSRLIEEVFGEKVYRTSRYAIKKEPDVFDRDRLLQMTMKIPDGFELKLIDRPIYESCMTHEWSRDLCSQFKDFEDYAKRGIGVVALCNGVPVSGASSYTVYTGGIEIEIDTKEEYRRKGLATAAGARLILECLERNIYPSWDAHDLRSVALAEKLGYHRDGEYTVYIKIDGDNNEFLQVGIEP